VVCRAPSCHDVTHCAPNTKARDAAGKASAAIDAALEAVRKHWIQKELTGAGGGPPITPAARPRPGTTSGSGPPAAAAASLRSDSGTLAAGVGSPTSPKAASAIAPKLQGGIEISGGSGGVAASGSGTAVPAAASGLAARLANTTVSRIFSSRAKQLDRIGEAEGALDDAEGADDN
jgi:hypothetical protein